MNREEPGEPRAGDASGAPGAEQAGAGAQQPSEEELRAALEQELKRLTVNDVLLQTVVSLLNLGGRRAGLAPGTEDERDLEQVQTAVEGARAPSWTAVEIARICSLPGDSASSERAVSAP